MSASTLDLVFKDCALSDGVWAFLGVQDVLNMSVS